jgi:hypothetical protein
MIALSFLRGWGRVCFLLMTIKLGAHQRKSCFPAGICYFHLHFSLAHFLSCAGNPFLDNEQF